MSNAVGKNLNEFLYFAPNCSGANNERAVFVDPKLLLPFLDLIDIRNTSAKKLANEITDSLTGRLQSSAGNIQSESNLTSPGEHRSNFGPVQVTYTIVQDKGPNNRGPGVYITGFYSLNVGANGSPYKDKPGLYLVDRKGDYKWGLRKGEKPSKMTTIVGAIGAKMDGLYYDADLSAQEYGVYIEKTIGYDKAEEKFSLFYAPGYIIDSLGTWQTPDQKKISSGSQQRCFAEILKATVSETSAWEDPNAIRKKHVWFVFDDGVKFLQESLSKFSEIAGGYKLEKHEFRFVNPKLNIFPVTEKITSLGANITQSDEFRINELNSKVHHSVDIDSYNKVLGRYKGMGSKNSAHLCEVEDAIKKYYPAKNLQVSFAEVVKKIISDQVFIDEWR